jgi:UDP-N-acetylmuramate dehydrogenase
MHMSGKFEEVFSKMRFNGVVRFMEPMSNHSSLKIGGPADIFVIPEDHVSLKKILITLQREDIPYFPLGGGTNVLIKDEGIKGAVISLKSLKGIEVLNENETSVHIKAEAGVPLQKLVAYSRGKGLTGLEWLVGIPGLLGGAICGNAGAFGSEIKDVLFSVLLMDTRGMLNRFLKENIHFGYRRSSISSKNIIVAAEFMLRKGVREDIASRIGQFMREKRERQPIAEPSAGCVFKNPPGMAAGKLLDEAGCKGMRKGDIEVSRLHANFFINRGNGTASDFLQLMGEVSGLVRERFGIILEPEIKIVGKERDDG